MHYFVVRNTIEENVRAFSEQKMEEIDISSTSANLRENKMMTPR